MQDPIQIAAEDLDTQTVATESVIPEKSKLNLLVSYQWICSYCNYFYHCIMAKGNNTGLVPRLDFTTGKRKYSIVFAIVSLTGSRLTSARGWP